MQEISDLKEKLKQEIDDITNNIENMQNLGFESEKEKERLNSEINISKERITNNKENDNRYNAEIEEIKLRIKDLEEEKKAKLDKKNNLFTNKEKFKPYFQHIDNYIKDKLDVK